MSFKNAEITYKIALRKEPLNSLMMLEYCKQNLDAAQLLISNLASRTMNHVYLLAEAPPCSFTRHFENMNNHHAIVLGLGISDKFILSSPEMYGWCATCASVSRTAVVAEINLTTLFKQVLLMLFFLVKRSYATWRDAKATDMFVFTSIQLLVETQCIYSKCIVSIDSKK